MRPELAGSTDAIARFEREVRSVAKIRHSNIVTVFEADRDRGVPYLAMEFVPGTSLDPLFAEARARELEHMAQFQRRVLTRIDSPSIGAHIRKGLRDEARTAWSRAGADLGEPSARFDALLQDANVTNVAVAALMQDVLEPAVAAAEGTSPTDRRSTACCCTRGAARVGRSAFRKRRSATNSARTSCSRRVREPDDGDTLAARANLDDA